MSYVHPSWSWVEAPTPPTALSLLWTFGALAACSLLLQVVLPRRKMWSAKDRTILVTGASSGIGHALARRYAAEGANLWLVARRRGALKETCEACLAAGAKSARVLQADVATEAGWEAIKSAVEPDALDLLVLNAGLAMGATFSQVSESGEAMPIMKKLMDVNYLGSVGVLDACLPAMRRARGGIRILVVSSVVGLVAPPTRTGYAASKFALCGFFNALRVELMSEPLPATVTISYPGAVRTEINLSRLVVGSLSRSSDGGGDRSSGVDISLDKSMSADRCASIMVAAHAAGERDVLYSIDGTLVGAVKTRVLRYLAFFFPGAADAALAATMRAMSKSR